MLHELQTDGARLLARAGMTSRRVLVALVLGVIVVFALAGIAFGWGHYGEPSDLLPPK